MQNGSGNVVTVQPISVKCNNKNGHVSEDDTSNQLTSNEVIHKAVDSVSRAVNCALAVKNGQNIRNKFTEGNKC